MDCLVVTSRTDVQRLLNEIADKAGCHGTQTASTLQEAMAFLLDAGWECPIILIDTALGLHLPPKKASYPAETPCLHLIEDLLLRCDCTVIGMANAFYDDDGHRCVAAGATFQSMDFIHAKWKELFANQLRAILVKNGRQYCPSQDVLKMLPAYIRNYFSRLRTSFCRFAG